MQKRSSKKQGPEDTNKIAYRVYEIAIEENTAGEDAPPEVEKMKNPAAVALGKLGGKSGGAARAASLTPEERSEIAKRAAAARWSKIKG